MRSFLDKMVDCIKNIDKCKARCCKSLTVTTKIRTQDLLRYYKLHGCELVRVGREMYTIIMPVRCTALTEDNLCSLHESGDKPNVCKMFDEGKTTGFWVPPTCVLNK